MPVPLLIAGGIVLALIAITSNVRLALFAMILTPLFAWLLERDLDMIYIYYPLALLLFIGIYTLIGLKGELAKAGTKKNLIIDRDHTFWQTKKADR